MLQVSLLCGCGAEAPAGGLCIAAIGESGIRAKTSTACSMMCCGVMVSAAGFVRSRPGAAGGTSPATRRKRDGPSDHALPVLPQSVHHTWRRLGGSLLWICCGDCGAKRIKIWLSSCRLRFCRLRTRWWSRAVSSSKRRKGPKRYNFSSVDQITGTIIAALYRRSPSSRRSYATNRHCLV